MATMEYNTSNELAEWFGLSTPLFLTTLLGVYLLYVLKIGPDYMKKRKPYELKTFIVAYNLVQVVTCIYIVIKSLHLSSLKVFLFWQCAIFESNTLEEYTFNRLVYFVFWVKVAELSETVVFVLRKKQRQVSKLHVFHHCSTLTIFYAILRNINGGAQLWPLMLNSIVHTIMYMYYLLAAVCDKDVMQRLLPVKKSITTIQMIQFVLILLQVFIIGARCTMPKVLIAYFACVVGIIFYGFYDFYRDSYTKRAQKE